MSGFDYGILAKNWPSPIVSRTAVEKFSGGLLSARTLANLDSLGEGPPRSKFGSKGKVFYLTTDLVAWLQARAKAGK